MPRAAGRPSPAQQWVGLKPAPSIIDGAAPKESVDDWPLAIDISDELGGMPAHR